MTATTYKVRVFEIQKRYRTGDIRKTRPTRYVVRWSVNRRQFQESFKLSAQADSFRSELMSAAKKGEAFDVGAGRPISMLRVDTDSMAWFEFSLDYCSARWEELAAGSRRNLVRDLSDITVALLRDGRGRPDAPTLGKALRIVFNVKTRHAAHQADIADAVAWAKQHSRDVRELADPEVFRRLISALDKTRSGARAAPDTIRLRRTTLGNAIEYAIEKGLLDTNPIRTVKVRKNKTALREVDSAAVVSPMQARTLLLALRSINRRLVAFFGLMYFAGLRPEEAVNVRKSNLSLPEKGWGEIRLERAVPEISGEWTDSGERNEETSLKHRERHESRTVPCCPELTGLLHEHLRDVGTTADGRLFCGVRAYGRLSSSVYGRAWAAARREVFTAEVYDSPLCRRPYDLRHACVSGWLAAKVESARVAKWAGHSVAVLHKVYAKFIDGGEQQALQRIDEWYGSNVQKS